MDKSWDHPWTTEEMRKKRREWSLAGDAGLLKHLQQFSENLMSKASKTQEALDSLTTQLSETAILIDNVTNTSLALANTQFIESRVQEDDIEVEKKTETLQQNSKDQDLEAANVIANVSESVRQGLRIMDEKYKRMEVVDSDSEDEDDAIVLSVILGPNNPYQDRPLPYVIGSDKWKVSNKIGLESSSSESEQVDEEEESESDKDIKIPERISNMNSGPKINANRLSSSSGESDNYNDQTNSTGYMNNEKLDNMSQTTINSGSDTTPIKNMPKVSQEVAPNFAEELAKRLGGVRQAEKSIITDDAHEPSINRFKDDLFTPQEDEDVFSNKAENIFSQNKASINDQLSTSLWKQKPNKSFKSNIIPPSVDVPPPISTVSTKPKSAIDDLFADADSEDSDDIFSSKSTVKRITKDNTVDNKHTNAEAAQKKYINIVAPGTTNMATSTPEMNVNSSNLFNDEGDNDDLFGTFKEKSHQTVEISPLAGQNVGKKKPLGGVSILGNILTSDIEKRLSSGLLRRQSSGSSNSDTTSNYDNSRVNEENTRSAYLSDNIGERNSIIAGNAENSSAINEDSRSSGISVKPPSMDNTAGSSMGVDFQPQMTSTRLKSEEIYRERIVSDSLFASRDPGRTNSETAASNQQREEQEEGSSSLQQDDVFDNEDLFGPPPLPKADSKAAKSKVTSLFDDSDSGDELFSTTSSGSRSQKSTDFLATTPQNPEKNKSQTHRRGLFDEDVDIFGNRDSPEVDIFATKPPATREESSISGSQKPAIGSSSIGENLDPIASKGANAEKSQVKRPLSNRTSLFDNNDSNDNDYDDVDDDDLFGVKSLRSERRVDPQVFKEKAEDDLFEEVSSKRPISENRKDKTLDTSTTIGPKMDDVDARASLHEKKGPADRSARSGLFSSAVNAHGLLFEDDDYDDLFGKKEEPVAKERQEESKAVREEESKESKVEDDSMVIDRSKDEKGPDKSYSSIPITDTSFASSKTIVSPDAFSPKTLESEDKESVQETLDGVGKKHPPKTLNIRVTASTGPDEGNHAPRRAVSGKIKDLMGKMGDLKILSPTDTPPLWRKSEEKTDEEDDVVDRDSDDGGCVSTQSRASIPSLSEGSHKQSPPPVVTEGGNEEVAISFDQPVQVETLPTAASKSRVRIQAKRRPQSRHARKSALRQSGIDFDTVDSAEDALQSENRLADVSDNKINRESTTSSIVKSNVAHSNAPSSMDRLAPVAATGENVHRTIDSSVSLTTDDKSELGSLSKESSMSANKNTLLSPSTDEEDLFDVPPDLPEDPQKEDALFGRAPILSPVENILSKQISFATVRPLRETVIRRTDEDDVFAGVTLKRDSAKRNAVIIANNDDVDKEGMEKSTDLPETSRDQVAAKSQQKQDAAGKQQYNSNEDKDAEEDVFGEEPSTGPTDPLRDSSHDPLKDPSQLFAFVTKTPSPEKGKSLLFAEDDSLFTSGPKKPIESRAPKKQILDLFADDAGGDLFSAPLTKPVKKPLKDTKISLFDDEAQLDEDDSLFGFVTKKTASKSVTKKSNVAQSTQKRTNLFEDDDDDDRNLFGDSEPVLKVDSKKVPEEKSLTASDTIKASKIDDIFGDQFSGDEDIFAAKKTIHRKVISSKSLFSSDGDDSDGDMFAKPSASSDIKAKIVESRPTIKKSVTRDLKKTAEKIDEDPLSILQDE